MHSLSFNDVRKSNSSFSSMNDSGNWLEPISISPSVKAKNRSSSLKSNSTLFSGRYTFVGEKPTGREPRLSGLIGMSFLCLKSKQSMSGWPGHIFALLEIVAEDIVKLCQDEVGRQVFLRLGGK